MFGNVGGFFASEGGSCHRGFTIVLRFRSNRIYFLGSVGIGWAQVLYKFLRHKGGSQDWACIPSNLGCPEWGCNKWGLKWSNIAWVLGNPENTGKKLLRWFFDFQKRPDVHKIVLSIKLRFSPPPTPPPKVSIFYRCVQFFLILGLFGGGGGQEFYLCTPRLF